MNWQPCPHSCLMTAGSCENLANTYWQSTCGMPVKVASSKCWNRRCSLYPWWWLFNSPTVLAERHILQALIWEVCWVCEEIIPSCDSRLWRVFWGPFHQRHGPCSKKHPAWPWCAVYSWHVALWEKGVPLQYHQQTAVHSSCWKMLGGEWYSGEACSGGCWLCHSSGGTSADCVIVQVALRSAMEYATVLVGEDTDLLILLLFHVKSDMKDVFFSSTRASATRRWEIKRTQSCLGPNVCKNILFAHAFGGCDTTSRPFGVGKSVPVKRMQQKNKPFENGVKVFLRTNSDHQMIAETGEKLLVDIYNRNDGDTLDKLRLVKYH